jgi:hypothetical protein
MKYYNLAIIKVLLYRSPAGTEGGSQTYREETISIGDNTDSQISEADAIQICEDTEIEVLAGVDTVVGFTKEISYAINRKAAANILYLIYQDTIAEENAKWQYANHLSEQADGMITSIDKKESKGSVPLIESKYKDSIFNIEKNDADGDINDNS